LTSRLAVFSDVHGNVAALEAVRAAIKKEKPDVTMIAGDHVMNGPEPGAAVEMLRAMEAEGAIIVQGNTDIAAADQDYGAAFPWLPDGVSDAVKAVAEWTHDALDDDQLSWLPPAPGRAPHPDRRHARPRHPRLAGLADVRLRS